MPLLSLANEILFLIAENLELLDLNSFLQANRRLATLLTPNFRKLTLGEDNATAALYTATAVDGSKDLIRFLLEEGEGISVRGVTARARSIHTSPGKASDELVRFVLSQKTNLILKDGTALHWAAAKKRKALIKLLLKNGANIDSQDLEGMTPLHVAASLEDGSIAQILLENDAHVNSKNYGGMTPLHVAASLEHASIVQLLLENGADINSRDYGGMTPLHIAASLEDGSIVRLLLENDAHVNAKDNGGMTPLHVAASRGHEMAVRFLLEGGADINAQDGRKWSPLHLAARGGEIMVIHLLLDNRSNATFPRILEVRPTQRQRMVKTE